MLRDMSADPTTRDCTCDQFTLGVLHTERRFAYYEPCERCLVGCARCDGVGFVFETNDEGYEVAVRCPDCGLQRAALERFNRANILSDFATASLEDLDVGDRASNLGQVVAKVRKWNRGFLPGVKGFCLIGGVGTGKTHLLTTTVRLAVTKGMSAKYVDFSILLNDLRQAYDQDSPTTPIIKPMVETQLLAIDELGKGRKSEWELTIIDQLINERYSRGMTTVFASNFDPPDDTAGKVRRGGRDHDTLIAQTNEHLELRIGTPLYSRVCAMADFIHIDAPDWRKR